MFRGDSVFLLLQFTVRVELIFCLTIMIGIFFQARPGMSSSSSASSSFSPPSWTSALSLAASGIAGDGGATRSDGGGEESEAVWSFFFITSDTFPLCFFAPWSEEVPGAIRFVAVDILGAGGGVTRKDPLRSVLFKCCSAKWRFVSRATLRDWHGARCVLSMWGKKQMWCVYAPEAPTSC